MTRPAAPSALAASGRATSGGAHLPLRCRNCGDPFEGPERDCPSPSAGRAPYKDSGRGGHVFVAPPEPPPPESLTAGRLREIARLAQVRGPHAAFGCECDGCLQALALADLLAEHERLRAECRRLSRCLLESVGAFTTEQIEQILEVAEGRLETPAGPVASPQRDPVG